MSDIPSKGATLAMITDEEDKLPRPLSTYHKNFLNTWNGANLDFIRVYGVHEVENTFLKELGAEHQEWQEIIDEVANKVEKKVILFADDISGFMYFELENGSILELDTDGGDTEIISKDMSDFFLNYLFGERANEYSGDDWLQELKDAKIIGY